MWNSVDILTINFLVNRQTTESVICCLFSWTITVEPCPMTLLLTNSEMGAGLMRESWASLTVFIPLDRERAVERSPGRPTDRANYDYGGTLPALHCHKNTNKVCQERKSTAVCKYITNKHKQTNNGCQVFGTVSNEWWPSTRTASHPPCTRANM